MSIPYTLTNDSITIVHKGKPVTVRKGAPNYVGLRQAIALEKFDEIEKHLTVVSGLKEWVKGRFAVSADGQVLSFDGRPLPTQLNSRIIQMAGSGENPTPLLKFWERLQLNPSMRSVEQLWPFLDHKGIPITEDGCFLAYKGVRQDYYDAHSGKFLNKPGEVMKMPRNQISDDPNHACHAGFHVGALEYARSFAARLVICKVDPQNVVCIPYDHGAQKMRVCEYEVVGEYGSQMSSTTVTDIYGKAGPSKLIEDEDEEEQDEIEDSGFEDSDSDEELDEREEELDEEIEEDELPDDPSDARDDQLMKYTLERLRKHASKDLKIVGAYSIPGGKTALVSRIVDIRKKS